MSPAETVADARAQALGARSTFVIMEAAGCHDGVLVKALRLVELAREAGADAVKFQWLSSPQRLVERRQAADYREAYQVLSFPREWFPMLRDAAIEAGLEFMCTVYLPEDIHVVAPYVSRFKIASFEARDAHFVGLHAEFGKPVIVSTGMAARHEVAAIVQSWKRARAGKVGEPLGLHVLHCVSAYPCPVEQASLAVLRANPYDDRRIDGFSDHTRHPWTGALAVAAGATIVEFHARLDDTDPTNADYAVSRTPEEAADYVRHIRLAETMMGTGVKEPQPSEVSMMRYRVGAKEGT